MTNPEDNKAIVPEQRVSEDATKAVDSKVQGDDTKTGSAGSTQGVLNRLKPVSEAVALITGVGAVLAFIAATLAFLVGTPELMLTVWFREIAPIYPSKVTGGVELPFEIGGELVHTATIIDLQISNSAKQLIGKQDDTWMLKLTSPDGTHLRLIGQVKSEPHHELVARWAQLGNNEIALYLRAFESRASVALRLLVSNAQGAQQPLVAVAPSLTGVPLNVTTRSPVERKRERLFLPFFVLFLLVFVVTIFWERRAADRDQKQKPSWITTIFLLVIVAFFYSFFASSGIGWLLSLLE